MHGLLNSFIDTMIRLMEIVVRIMKTNFNRQTYVSPAHCSLSFGRCSRKGSEHNFHHLFETLQGPGHSFKEQKVCYK